MLYPNETLQQIRKGIADHGTSGSCVLFLLSLNDDLFPGSFTASEQNRIFQRIETLLKRVFRSYDTIGVLPNGFISVFLYGSFDEEIIWSKSSCISEIMDIVRSELDTELPVGHIGVYMCSNVPVDADQMITRAEYALEMARKSEGANFHIEHEDASGVHRVDLGSDACCGELQDESGRPLMDIRHLRGYIREKNDWLRFLSRQTDYQLWELDIKHRTFSLLYTNDLLEGRQSTYRDFPRSLIESGRIHQDSIERFSAFAADMMSGKPDGSDNFMIQYRQSSCFGWANMSYHTIYDEDGHPDKVIGIKKDLSYLPELQRSQSRRLIPPQLYPHLFIYMQADLSSDKLFKLHVEGMEQSRLISYASFSDILDIGIHRLFSSDAASRIGQRFSREVLLGQYDGGRHFMYESCQIVDHNGSIQWLDIGVNLTKDIETGHIHLFAYISTANRRKDFEKLTGTDADPDPETGLYSVDTGRLIIRKGINAYEQNSCSMAVIRFIGADELFRDPKKPEKYLDLVTALNIFLDTDCIVMRRPDGAVNAFFPNTISKEYLQRRLENAFSFMRVALSDMPELRLIRFVAGVVSSNPASADIDEMERLAAAICMLHTGEAADTVVFSNDHEKYNWNSFELSDTAAKDTDFNTISTMHMHIMDDADKNMALECLELMLKSDSPDTAIDGVLRKIGHYYQADRVYILNITENETVINMVNEWVTAGKYSIRRSVSGKQVKHFPVIARYIKRPSPVFLTIRRNMDNSNDVPDPKQGFWKYSIYPMSSQRGSRQLLCIDNHRVPIDQTALLDEIVPYIRSERMRFLSDPERQLTSGGILSLPDANAYNDVIYNFSSDRYSSMGAMTADIPELSYIGRQRGYEYSLKMLMDISEIFVDIFGFSNSFHIAESEFVIICTNVTYEAFLNRCVRARQLINRKYAGVLRFGYTWSERIFDGSDLVRKAREIMKCSTPAVVGPAQSINDLSASRTSAVNGSMSFTIYMQPKVDMRSGELVGAEALVRIKDKRGNLLSHTKIIEAMDADRTIQNLDYFVFDRTLETISSWKQKGYPKIHVSSNFSRNTLLNTSSLASLLAIISRYPEISDRLPEIEITETAGSFENNTFSDLIRRFAEYGFTFSLDDFGSAYSNLSMLAELPFRSVKLDRSMIRSITDNPISKSMVQDTARLCKKAGIACIAEGVETERQANILIESGCNYAQGFYFGRPMPVEEFEKRYFEKEGGQK